MNVVRVERLDHLGIVAGVIHDLGIIEMIDSRIEPDEREEISTGEAIAGMILNSLFSAIKKYIVRRRRKCRPKQGKKSSDFVGFGAQLVRKSLL